MLRVLFKLMDKQQFNKKESSLRYGPFSSNLIYINSFTAFRRRSYVSSSSLREAVLS